MTKTPNLNDDDALERLYRDIKSLDDIAKKVKRNSEDINSLLNITFCLLFAIILLLVLIVCHL